MDGHVENVLSRQGGKNEKKEDQGCKEKRF
jgi:hypothetical protein